MSPHSNMIMIVRRLFLTCVGGFHTLILLFFVFCIFHVTIEFPSFLYSAARRTHVYHFVWYVVSCHLYTLLS